jgi:uncharacterized protein (DUF1015 family)
VRPAPEQAADVAAVPYDVVSASEARTLAGANPLSFLRVSRPELELADGANPYADDLYERAAANYARLKAAAPLAAEGAPRLYVYSLRMGTHEQTGICGCASVAEYDRDIVRKHERTRKDKEDDRTRHIVQLRAQTGPVFLAYRDQAAIDGTVEQVRREKPLYDILAPDGVQHRIWVASEPATRQLAAEFLRVPLFYIADGHHRAASASRAGQQLAGAGANDEAAFFLAVAFPAGQLQILPYNRIVHDLAGRRPEEFVALVRRHCGWRETGDATPVRKGDVGVYLQGHWHMLVLPAAAAPGPAAALDAERLQRAVLEPVLGIGDPRTDKRIDFVGGIRGTTELEQWVDSGRAAVAFSLYPVAMEDLMAVSDAGELMPPKSTSFEPKLRDGLLIHEI